MSILVKCDCWVTIPKIRCQIRCNCWKKEKSSVGLGVVRNRACETAIASTEAVCINVPVSYFQQLVDRTPQLAALFYHGTPLIEVYDLLAQHLKDRPDGDALLRSFGAEDLRELALKIAPQTTIRNLEPGKTPIADLDPQRSWFVSNGRIEEFPIGSAIEPYAYPTDKILEIVKPERARLVGVPLLEVFDATDGLSSSFNTDVSSFKPTQLGD